MIHQRTCLTLALLLPGLALGCSGSNSDKGSNNNNSGYNVGGNGAGGSTSVQETLQSNGTLLLKGIIRDFPKTFPDMEPCTNNPVKLCDSKHDEQHPGCESTNECIVTKTLAADEKPVYEGNPSDPASGTETTTGPDNFNKWFHDNTMAKELDLTLTPDATNTTYTYNNMAFFPIDGWGYGNEGQDANGVWHNFNFTTEWHLIFTYEAGQTFQFHGDDDLWVFVDGKLAIDLGGIHDGQDSTLELGTLGLTPGTDYSFDIFYCERHVQKSEIEIQTSIKFTGSTGVIIN